MPYRAQATLDQNSENHSSDPVPDDQKDSIMQSNMINRSDSSYSSLSSLHTEKAEALRSHRIDDISEYEQDERPLPVSELEQQHFMPLASMMQKDKDGLQTLATSLKPALTNLAPGLSKISPGLARESGRRARAFEIMQTLHKDPNAKLFPIRNGNQEVRGLVGLVRQDKTTHLIAWMHPENRNTNFSKRPYNR